MTEQLNTLNEIGIVTKIMVLNPEWAKKLEKMNVEEHPTITLNLEESYEGLDLEQYGLIRKEDLKAEAIKWIRAMRTSEAYYLIGKFPGDRLEPEDMVKYWLSRFNLSEEDLK